MTRVEDKAREVLLAYLPRSVSCRLDENDRGLIVGSMLAFADMRLDEAAEVCRQQARDFLDPQYATPQPIGSIQERFACNECATAIESLKDQK